MRYLADENKNAPLAERVFSMAGRAEQLQINQQHLHAPKNSILTSKRRFDILKKAFSNEKNK